MDRYESVKNGLLGLARSCTDIKAIIIIGSQARSAEKADEFSDLDIILVTGQPEDYLYSDDKLSAAGRIRISFTEHTLGGAMERRVLLDGSLDVDIIPLRPEEFAYMLENGIANGILSRGYAVLYDDGSICMPTERLRTTAQSDPPINESEFINTVSDFWYHTVWCAKKIARGEFWTALTCIDGYLKQRLLRMIELSAHVRSGGQCDVWHNGRLMERWASASTVEALGSCFGRYDRTDIISALKGTAELFARLSRECAASTGFDYPSRSEEYAVSEYSRLLDE